MAFDTYADLKAYIADAMNRTDLTAQIPAFIRSAHDTIVRDVRIPLVEKSASLTVGTSGAVAVPADYRASVRLITEQTFDNVVTPSTSEQIARWRSVGLQTDTNSPLYFAREQGNFVFWPVPSADVDLTLVYMAGPVLMVDDADTNVILERYPFLYVYGAMAEGSRFIMFAEDEAKYEALFRDMVDKINGAEQADALAGGALMPTPSTSVV